MLALLAHEMEVVTKAFRNTIPFSASLSMLGVLINELPVYPIASYLWSSVRRNIILGKGCFFSHPVTIGIMARGRYLINSFLIKPILFNL
jgi:hypothetical protein